MTNRLNVVAGTSSAVCALRVHLHALVRGSEALCSHYTRGRAGAGLLVRGSGDSASVFAYSIQAPTLGFGLFDVTQVNPPERLFGGICFSRCVAANSRPDDSGPVCANDARRSAPLASAARRAHRQPPGDAPPTNANRTSPGPKAGTVSERRGSTPQKPEPARSTRVGRSAGVGQYARGPGGSHSGAAVSRDP
jgi:hypothetical protein